MVVEIYLEDAKMDICGFGNMNRPFPKKMNLRSSANAKSVLRLSVYIVSLSGAPNMRGTPRRPCCRGRYEHDAYSRRIRTYDVRTDSGQVLHYGNAVVSQMLLWPGATAKMVRPRRTRVTKATHLKSNS